MRIPVAAGAVALCLACASCGAPATPAGSRPTGTTADSSAMSDVDLGRVGQTRGEVPAGFEFADLAGRDAPAAQWGLGARWSVEPPSCAGLADPGLDPATLRGWSASGPGAIVYVAAAASTSGVDAATRADCARFSVAAGHTSGDVTTVAAPEVSGAETLGLLASTTTTVEGGTETRSHAETLIAYLPGHVTYVTVVTDPGSGAPALDADFAAGLLTSTTSALRGG